MRRHSLMQLAMAVVLAVTCVAVLAAQVSTKPTIDASMSMLVSEVHELRLAVERSGMIAAQAQVLLGRVQLQENRLATLGRNVVEARGRLRDAETSQFGLEQTLRQAVAAASSARTPEERQALTEDRIPGLKAQIRRAQQLTERFRAEDAAAAAALAEEQSRWSDFNGRLESLERSLAAAATLRR